MKKIFCSLMFAGALLFSIGAYAIPVDIMTTATADNVYWIWDDVSSSWGSPVSSTWTTSTATSLEVEAGVASTLYFAVLNDISSLAPGSNNPAGFLAQMVLPAGSSFQETGTDMLLTGNSAFSVLAVQSAAAAFPSGDPSLLAGWSTPTSYGTNSPSDPNIWSSVAGISYDAEWIWTANNANSQMDNLALVKVDFTADSPVPEPSTLILLGSGLLGLGFLRKRSRK